MTDDHVRMSTETETYNLFHPSAHQHTLNSRKQISLQSVDLPHLGLAAKVLKPSFECKTSIYILMV